MTNKADRDWFNQIFIDIIGDVPFAKNIIRWLAKPAEKDEPNRNAFKEEKDD